MGKSDELVDAKAVADAPTIASEPADLPAPTATAPEESIDRALPKAIGRFKVHSKLGAGGMGTVLLATDPSLDRKVALKVLHREDRENARERFVREAQAMAKLSHENVVVVHEVGTDEGRVYIAMELVAGGTLTRWQARKGWREILDVYIRAGRGLEAAHRAGLVHRDFKPDNVLVDGTKVRVTDFGLVAASDGDEEKGPTLPPELGVSLTRSGALLGTPRYMAPEQHLGDPIDARADQFAFCVALYEALYAQKPFVGESLPELATSVTAGDLVPPPAASDVPPNVRDAIVRGLSRDREARFPSMAELLAELQPTEPKPVERERKPKRWATWSRRKLWLVFIVLPTVFGITIFVTMYFVMASVFHTDDPPPAPPPAQVAPVLETPNDLGDAKERFEAGQKAYLAGKYDEAALGFLDAYAAKRLPQFLFNVGAAFHLKGKKTSSPEAYRMAVTYYRRYAKTDPSDRAKVEKAITVLSAEIERLEAGSATTK